MPKKIPKKTVSMESPATERKITKEDAAHNRYPDSKTPGVHRDSAPIGGG
ncbi:hypothetical protein SDC9_75322 [bioreactor metagenome]|uniref:Uncharacterized protein n=1 Tax=bioreactor metagenome TaxID=1076179 RepID=A0A644YJI6_9ZZZZ